MARSKAKSILVRLVSSIGTGFFYVTRKNPKNITRKLAFRKYDPIARRHVLFTGASGILLSILLF